MHLIVGLGNPGPRYVFSRHNVGFRLLDCLAKKNKISIAGFVDSALHGAGIIKSKNVVLAKPLTYMNRSGISVSRLVRRYNINISLLLIIYDDMDLDLGRLRFRTSGGTGGHRGLDSVISYLGNPQFNRLRIGISRPLKGMNSADYVLSEFNRAEEKYFQEKVLPMAVEAVEHYISNGIDAAMTKYNRADTDNLQFPLNTNI